MTKNVNACLNEYHRSKVHVQKSTIGNTNERNTSMDDPKLVVEIEGIICDLISIDISRNKPNIA